MEQYEQFYNYNNFQGNFYNCDYSLGHNQYGGPQLPPISQPYWKDKEEKTYGLNYINTQKSYDTFNTYNNYVKPIINSYSPMEYNIPETYKIPTYDSYIYKIYDEPYPRTKKLYNNYL